MLENAEEYMEGQIVSLHNNDAHRFIDRKQAVAYNDKMMIVEAPPVKRKKGYKNKWL